MAGGKRKRKKKEKMRARFVASYDKLVTDEPEELITRIIDYCYDCNDSSLPYTATGMGLALGLKRQTFLDFGEDDHENAEVVAIVATAKLMIEDQLEQRLQGRSSAGVSLNLKSNFGWRDVSKFAIGTGENGDEPLHPVSVDVSKFPTELLKALVTARDASTATD